MAAELEQAAKDAKKAAKAAKKSRKQGKRRLKDEPPVVSVPAPSPKPNGRAPKHPVAAS